MHSAGGATPGASGVGLQCSSHMPLAEHHHIAGTFSGKSGNSMQQPAVLSRQAARCRSGPAPAHPRAAVRATVAVTVLPRVAMSWVRDTAARAPRTVGWKNVAGAAEFEADPERWLALLTRRTLGPFAQMRFVLARAISSGSPLDVVQLSIVAYPLAVSFHVRTADQESAVLLAEKLRAPGFLQLRRKRALLVCGLYERCVRVLAKPFHCISIC